MSRKDEDHRRYRPTIFNKKIIIMNVGKSSDTPSRGNALSFPPLPPQPRNFAFFLKLFLEYKVLSVSFLRQDASQQRAS